MEVKHTIKNFYELAKTKKHEDLLKIVEAGYESINTQKVIEKNLILKGGILNIKGSEFDLDSYENIYIVGFGKVVCEATAAIEKILKDRIKGGAVIGIKSGVCSIVDDYQGTHPMPSTQNFKATEHIAKVGESATEKDLVIVVAGGGGSALLCSSEEERDQGQKLYKDFLKTGGNIEELNTVRKHISKMKGGGLAKLLYPATVVGLVFSDVPGDDGSGVASGPTYKDKTTVVDAENILAKYDISDFDLIETPKENKYFDKVHNILLLSNKDPLEAMEHKAISLGYEAEIIGDDFYGLKEEISKSLLEKAGPNRVVLAGGEMRVVVPEGCDGKGGRNDYLALHMSSLLKENQAFAAFASDGHDNTDAAGAVVDIDTKEKIKNEGIDLDQSMVCLDSYPVMEKVGALIFTGYLESNVSDLMVLLQE